MLWDEENVECLLTNNLHPLEVEKKNYAHIRKQRIVKNLLEYNFLLDVFCRDDDSIKIPVKIFIISAYIK